MNLGGLSRQALEEYAHNLEAILEQQAYGADRGEQERSVQLGPDQRTHDLADSAIGLFLEYRDVHGYSEDQARAYAVQEVIEGERAREEIAAHEDTEGREHGWPLPDLAEPPAPLWAGGLDADRDNGRER
jgi:hypothetical protein